MIWLVATVRTLAIRDGTMLSDPVLKVADQPVKFSKRPLSDFAGDPEVRAFATEEEAKAFSAEREKEKTAGVEREKRMQEKVARERAAFAGVSAPTVAPKPPMESTHPPPPMPAMQPTYRRRTSLKDE